MSNLLERNKQTKQVTYKSKEPILITHPSFGSLYLYGAYVANGRVVGDVWDTSGSGSPLLPDDYRGEYLTMNFPLGSVRVKDLMQIIKCSVPVGVRPYFHFCNRPPKLSCIRCRETVCMLHFKDHKHYEPNFRMVG